MTEDGCEWCEPAPDALRINLDSAQFTCRWAFMIDDDHREVMALVVPRKHVTLMSLNRFQVAEAWTLIRRIDARLVVDGSFTRTVVRADSGFDHARFLITGHDKLETA